MKMEAMEFIFSAFKQFFDGILSIFSGTFIGIGNMFNFNAYADLVSRYTEQNGAWSWVVVILVFLVMLGIIGLLVFLIVLGIKKLVKLTKSLRTQDKLLKELGKLQKENAFFHDQMEKSLKKDLKDLKTGEEGDDELEGGDHKFSKLLYVDQKYKNGNDEVLNSDFTLLEVCTNFRNFSASRMRLYYDEEIVREFVASFAAVRLIILQGISGTGKTSLPYSFGKFLNNDSFIQAIQPSWRERSEMLGFFNEFTKKYKEPEFLRNLYEARYSNNVHITVLDEMNIARVEYYFAEFLSTLEIPRMEEWKVELVSTVEPDDPKLLEEGKLTLPSNMWFVGTANNDDSTFAISDKVYDRAMVIDIDKKFQPFEAEDADPMPLDCRHLYDLFEQAKEKYQVSQENLDKLAQLDLYVIEHFRVAFGNRIMKQLRAFVPVYMDCGGTELNGIDYVLVKKVFRKFGTLSATYLKREMDGLIAVIDDLWGEEEFPQSRDLFKLLLKNA